MNTFIKWESLDLRKQSGKEKVRCPNCDSLRSDKSDKSLAIDHGKGIGKCFYCEALTFRDEEEQVAKYTPPRQDWHNYTNLSDRMVKWLESRKISQSAAIALGWTEERFYQPAHGKEVNNLVFNSFEGERVVNKKYRSGDKKFTQSKDGKPILYNINAILGQEQAFIVEGEMDVAALWCVGVKNAVSVPNGANDNDAYWANSQKYLEGVKQIVIATDCDDKGIELRERIAQRLGRWRCTYIEFKGKDANDDLMSGCLEETIRDQKRFPVAGTFTIEDTYDRVLGLYENGLPKTIAPKSKDFGRLAQVFSVLRGQLTVVTGIPSHGKSNFNDWFVLNLINDYGMKASWFSPEHSPLELYQVNLIEKVLGGNFWGKSQGQSVQRLSVDQIEKYKQWASERIYLTEAEGGEMPTWDWLFAKFSEQMYSYGIDIFVIDAFNKVILPKGNELQAIRQVLTKLTAFAQANNVLIFLVAHPTKMKENEDGTYKMPDLYSVSGSADFRNMTHNGYTIYREFANEDKGTEDTVWFVVTKHKFSYQGKMGEKVGFKWNYLNGRFHTHLPNNKSLLEEEETPEASKQVKPIFDLLEEVPF